MGRLITEELIYEYLLSKFDEFDISILGNEFAGKILDGLSDIPTAYDVDKVVAELEDAKFLMPPENDNHYADNGLFLEDAIEIVRRGGVEWDVNIWKQASLLTEITKQHYFVVKMLIVIDSEKVALAAVWYAIIVCCIKRK